MSLDPQLEHDFFFPPYSRSPNQLIISNIPFYINSVLSIFVGSAKLRCENNLSQEREEGTPAYIFVSLQNLYYHIVNFSPIQFMSLIRKRNMSYTPTAALKGK